MKALPTFLALSSLIAATLSAGPLTQAKVTKIINDVSLIEGSGAGRKAQLQDVIQGQTALKTGIKSRSELLFQDNTLTRVGPETYFSFKSGTRDLTLGQGTMLLQVPPGLGGAKIRAAGITAGITGTTIMMEHRPNRSLKVLVLEGSLRLSSAGGNSVVVDAGRMVLMHPSARSIPQPVAVDIKKVMKTSSLVNMGGNKKTASLPSAHIIEKEIALQEQRKEQKTLIDTNLFIIGKGTNVVVAGDDLYASLNLNANISTALVTSSTTPADSTTVANTSPASTTAATPVPQPVATPTQLVAATPPPQTASTPTSLAGSSGGQPSSTPAAQPAASPAVGPSSTPALQPGSTPAAEPSATPLPQPGSSPAAEPSATPIAQPTATPAAEPSATPVAQPSSTPGTAPSPEPSSTPVTNPSATPGTAPSATPGSDSGASPTPPPASSATPAPSASPGAEPSPTPPVVAGDDDEDDSDYDDIIDRDSDQDLVVDKPIDVSKDGRSGKVNLKSRGTVIVKSTIKVSDNVAPNVSRKGGSISIRSQKKNGVAISIRNGAQLHSLLDGAAPGPGGAIKFHAVGGAVNVSGASIRADRGTIDIRNTGENGVISVQNATLSANTIKLQSVGKDGQLNIGGGTMSADSAIDLYASGSNGRVNFTDNVTLSGNSVKTISGNTVTISNGKTVNVQGNGPARVFTNNPNYSGSGGNGSTTGSFGGQGATTQSLSNGGGSRR